MKENLLIVVCSLNEAKVVLEGGDEAVDLPGDGAVEQPHGHGALLARALHLTDGKLHLKQEHVDRGRGGKPV